ncbi:glycosyltransferase family 2 protein [Phocaeicola barnesiae]|uniref:glycosyltransferase family 2 protein n=1 Tax=Phocaeicola barnesiae TaxID=376804 RepID=UPI0026707AB7|nr:glycosyltransferase family 2 protein [Phocaeicola barnesiae]
MNVVAVVVTYNRRELLNRNLSCLRANRPVQSIVVVNNGSTDGTTEWLKEQKDLIVIHQENVGGSGGFYRGIQHACQLKADWIWCMDDDVFPRADCMEHLLQYADDPSVGILAPRRLMEGNIFTNDFQQVNLTNPFASMYQKKLKKQQVDAPVEICGTAFEGLCIRREAVEAIGLPNKDLFIFCDDTDYCLRAVLAGYKILYIPSALMDKEKFFSSDNWEQRSKKKKWKRFYQIRNAAYLNHRYGKNWAVRYLRSFHAVLGYMAIVLVTAPFKDVYTLRDVAKFWKAYRDGVREKLGKY